MPCPPLSCPWGYWLLAPQSAPPGHSLTSTVSRCARRINGASTVAPEEVGHLDADDDIYVDDGLLIWPTAEPGDIDLDGVLLEQAATEVGQAPKIRSLLVARHGQLVLERYFHGAEPTYGFNLHSVTKSLLGLLVGVAIEDGHLAGLDVPIGAQNAG